LRKESRKKKGVPSAESSHTVWVLGRVFLDSLSLAFCYARRAYPVLKAKVQKSAKRAVGHRSEELKHKRA
jgi:hypothetical protein